jgi:CheY-like chemotaxis protein
LVVDDNEAVASQTADALKSATVWMAGESAEVELATNFQDALNLLADQRFDLVILDIRDESSVEPIAEMPGGDDATDADVGLDVFEQVRARRFIPVIFYTAVPNLAEHLIRSPFVDVVSKQAELDELREKVRAVFDSTLPRIHAELLAHVESVMRDFMIDFVELNWQELSTPPRKGDVAYLLLRRLALSLAEGGQILAGKLDDLAGLDLQSDSVHPMRYYVVPPIGTLKTGDIIRGPEVGLAGDDESGAGLNCWYVILTPACDLVPERVKAEFVVLARCVPLTETEEYAAWQSAGVGQDQAQRTKLQTAMRKGEWKNRNADRDFYLPAAWAIPDLLVDFQQLSHIAHSEIESYERVGTLDSPYAEALIQKLGRYLGRVGTPNLDVQMAMTRLAQLTPHDSSRDLGSE